MGELSILLFVIVGVLMARYLPDYLPPIDEPWDGRPFFRVVTPIVVTAFVVVQRIAELLKKHHRKG